MMCAWSACAGTRTQSAHRSMHTPCIGHDADLHPKLSGSAARGSRKVLRDGLAVPLSLSTMSDRLSLLVRSADERAAAASLLEEAAKLAGGRRGRGRSRPARRGRRSPSAQIAEGGASQPHPGSQEPPLAFSAARGMCTSRWCLPAHPGSQGPPLAFGATRQRQEPPGSQGPPLAFGATRPRREPPGSQGPPVPLVLAQPQRAEAPLSHPCAAPMLQATLARARRPPGRQAQLAECVRRGGASQPIPGAVGPSARPGALSQGRHWW